MRWFRFQTPLVEAVYKATVPFESETSVIVPRCSPKVIAKIIELHDGDYDGDQTMFQAFVTNDFEESSFGCLKDMHRQSNKIRKVSNITGPASCRMNGAFSTIEQMPRLEQKARGNRREDKMTKEEMVQFCEVPSIAAFDSCSADKQKETCDKHLRDSHKNQVTDPNNKLHVQIVETFGRRVAKRDGHEASTSETLKQFLAHEIMPVFTSIATLDAESQSIPSQTRSAAVASPIPTPIPTAITHAIHPPLLLQVEILKRQINIRRFVFGRKLAPGCLHSDVTCDGSPVKLTRLRATFKKLIRDEHLYPDLLKVIKPKIRKDFVAHTNPTEHCKTMDEDVGTPNNASAPLSPPLIFSVPSRAPRRRMLGLPTIWSMSESVTSWASIYMCFLMDAGLSTEYSVMESHPYFVRKDSQLL
jgi:hypothetical protein